MSEKAINVLLIEDDGDESSVIRRSLADGLPDGEAFAVKEASRPSTAFRLLARESFDAVLLDLASGRSAGIEDFRRLRSLRPDVPVLILTGLQDEAVAAAAVREGAQDYVIKGTPECCLLKRAIRHAIERGRLAREVERLFDGDACAMAVVDAAGDVRRVNPAAEALFGLKAESLVGRPFPYPAAADGPSRIAVPSPGSAGTLVETTSRAIEWNGTQARLIALRGAADAARLLRLEAEADGRLRSAEIKNRFLGRISHELRNTLATVKTAVFCLNDGFSGPLTPRQSRLVEMISRNVDRQVKIIDNILDLARFQSGRIEISPRPVELSRVVDELVQEFRLRNCAQRLAVEVADDLPALSADPDLLLQVLRNLVDNALRYARTRVTVKAADAGAEGVLLRVIDDGKGVPKERLGELFDQFVQLDRPKDGNGYKGTGLGLSICKEIVEGHRGRIWAESVEGRGASFNFVLPKAGPSDGAAAVTPRSKISDADGMAPRGLASL